MILRFKHLFVLMLLLPVMGHAQDKEVAKKNKVQSQTVQEYFIEEGLSDPVVEQIEKFDRDGNRIELKEFNKEGDIKDWRLYKYDAAGNNTEEIQMDMRGNQEERIVWVYKNGLVVEKKYFDHKDRLVKRKEYKYTYFNE